jgi:hypothetical protein
VLNKLMLKLRGTLSNQPPSALPLLRPLDMLSLLTVMLPGIREIFLINRRDTDMFNY